MQLIRRGDHGPAVAEVRTVLARLGLLGEPGDTGDRDTFNHVCELAVRTFQQRRGLSVDGIVGPETYRALSAARWRLGDRVLRHSVGTPMIGDDVAVLQERLLELGYDAGRPDGIFGVRTERALVAFQRESGLSLDGTFGPHTMRALHQLGRKVVGGRPQLMREEQTLARSGPALVGKRIVIDPGHGGSDPGESQFGLAEADIVWDLASRFEGRLVAVGVRAYLTRGLDTDASDLERARFANSTGADLLVSLHIDRHASPAAEGVATFHFGTGAGVSSTVGERLAGLVQREIVARTGMRDCGTHGKTWELLRLTAMPAVRLELGYLSNTDDRERLADPNFRDVVAEALVVAVQRLYLTKELDQPTGTMRIPFLPAFQSG